MQKVLPRKIHNPSISDSAKRLPANFQGLWRVKKAEDYFRILKEVSEVRIPGLKITTGDVIGILELLKYLKVTAQIEDSPFCRDLMSKLEKVRNHCNKYDHPTDDVRGKLFQTLCS